MGPRTAHRVFKVMIFMNLLELVYEERKIWPLFGAKVRGHRMFKCPLQTFCILYRVENLWRKGCGWCMSREWIDCDFREWWIGQKHGSNHNSASRLLLAMRWAMEKRGWKQEPAWFSLSQALQFDCGLEMTLTVLKKLFHVLKQFQLAFCNQKCDLPCL